MKMLYTAAEMREMDALAISEYNIPSIVLMENAAIAAFNVMEEMPYAKTVLIMCGSGNNGGDGYALARHAFNNGRDVRIYMTAPPGAEDAKTNYEIAKSLQIPFTDKIEGADLIVDAILGTGLKNNVNEKLEKIIDQINSLESSVLSLDIPSGIDADTGRVLGTAVKARKTVALGHLKIGHMQYPGREFSGEIVLKDISLPKGVNKISNVLLPEKEDIKKIFPKRSKDANKGSIGKVGIVAGSRGMTGAAVLSCRGAYRAGAGLVYLACQKDLLPVYSGRLLEEVIYPVSDESYFTLSSKDEILKMLEKCDSLVLGPGLSREYGVGDLVSALINETAIPLIIDADGINALGGNINILRNRENLVLTPHPGEFASLTGCSINEVQKNRVKLACALSVNSGAVVVLKGAGTVTALPDGRSFINQTGNPGMATGGSGDLLSGIIGSLLAAGLKPSHAAVAGVYIHGLAGDLAEKSFGSYGFLPGDMLNFIPEAVKDLNL